MAPKKIDNIWDPMRLSEKRRKKFLRYVTDSLIQTNDDRSRLIQHMRRADTLYEGHGKRTKNTPFKDASDVHVPEVATRTTAIHARLYTTLFGRDGHLLASL